MLAVAMPAQAENTFQIIKDEMTDAQRGIAAINLSGKITPIVKCDTNGPGSIYISLLSKEYLGQTVSRYGSGANRDAKFRFDGAEPYTVSASYNGRTANIFDLKLGTPGARILTDMLTSRRMVIELTDFHYASVSDAFDLGDSADVIKKAVQACQDTSLNLGN